MAVAYREADITDNISQRVGNTPLIRLRLFDERFPGATVLAKAEWFNPGGSVKDRAALGMILDAERRGLLGPGRTLIDSTSGNTGIAYAMIGSARGHRVRLVMPTNVSAERKELITAYGAEIVFSDPMEGSDGAIRLVRRLVEESPHQYYYPDQYSNPANWRAHYEGTAPEIWRQTEGRVTHFIAGLGTTGTFVGCSRRLRGFNSRITTIAVQPDDAFHGLEGLKHIPTSIVPAIWDPGVADEVWDAPTEASYELARRVARHEGLLVGHSCGAVLWAAERLLERLGEAAAEAVVVLIFPDSGARYLSTGVYQRRGR